MVTDLIRSVGSTFAALIFLAISPSEVSGQNSLKGIYVEIYTFTMDDQGRHFYYDTGFSAAEYLAALTTDVEFHHNCDGWNGYSTAQPRIVNDVWHIEVWRNHNEADCKRVDVTLFLFRKELVEYSARWEVNIDENSKQLHLVEDP